MNDVRSSAGFLIDHFGFREKMAADGFCSLWHDASGINIVYLQKGIEILPENFRHRHADGVILAFVATDIAAEEIRLKNNGVAITLPMQTESWGKKLFR